MTAARATMQDAKLTRLEFKTLDGAQRRAAFETAHSNYVWFTCRCGLDGAPDYSDYDPQKKYIWRLAKRKRIGSS
jgi:hypothetical protein